MGRRVLVIVGVVLACVTLCVVLIWPAAPLWQPLGGRVYCLQGAWPDIGFVACPPQAATTAVTPPPRPTLSDQAPVPLIVDDDGSPDGVLALLHFLRNPLFDVRAVTVSVGEAHPEIFARHLQQLLAGLGRPELPVGVGRATPLAGENAFPDPFRQASDDFWGVDYPSAPASLAAVPAAELMVEAINASSRPVTVFVSGPLTNLAEALRLDPGIVENMGDVYIMGGSLGVPGNIHRVSPDIDNTVAEWNIWVDPLAASEVFASAPNLHLAPLDSTEQVPWTSADARRWSASGTPEGRVAADILQMTLNSWSSSSVYAWDLVTAVWAGDPTLCPGVPLSVEVIVASGPTQGQTVARDGQANAAICLEPEADQIRLLAADVFGE